MYGVLLSCHGNTWGRNTRLTSTLFIILVNVQDKGAYDAVNASCVLDFYVCESCQRQGVGKALFDFVLTYLSTRPNLLAYDRPSPKLVAFLAKNYGLLHGIMQPNNFMIFREFFQGAGITTQSTY
jgi:GNAT superfamily N-acetyltransferase